jgi:FlaA1/EpsC-like NDP-sugar epimerase/CheY-like chemotaxis protein
MPGPAYWEERLQLDAEQTTAVSDQIPEVSVAAAPPGRANSPSAPLSADDDLNAASVLNVTPRSSTSRLTIAADPPAIKKEISDFLNENVKNKERLGHFLPMVGIGFCMMGLFRVRKAAVLKSVVWILFLTAMISLGIELLQELVPEYFHRGFALDDIGMALAGSLLGIGLALISRSNWTGMREGSGDIVKNRIKQELGKNHIFYATTTSIICCALAYLGAFFLRFDFGVVPEAHVETMWLGLPLILLVRIVVLMAFRAHHGLYRYVSLHDLVNLLKAVTLGSFVFAAIWVLVFNRTHFMPRSIYLLDWMLCLFLLGSMRLSVRLWRNRRNRLLKMSGGAHAQRALIVGAGNLGENILRIIDRRFLGHNVDVVGFVDDDELKLGTHIHGVTVLGKADAVSCLIEECNIQMIVFAISEPRAGFIESVVQNCDGLSVQFNTVTVLQDLASGEVSVDRMRNLRVEDLLGRDQVQVDNAAVSADLKGRTVLVTGAGGSIGSELCRQISAMKPRCIVLFESGETPLFEIDRELRQTFPELDIQPFIGDVKHRDVVDRAFELYQPDFIYHAAAYKHVPLMEAHPDEAVLNNVRGTRNVAEAARQFKCKRFVMISTDKAVRPTNVMGATKRMCELVVQSMNGADTVFAAVRFGNVLGSNGSVIPIFRKQLDQGGPLTVTHPDMTRYFMMIPEAVALVLQCGVIAEAGDTFVLDMGMPVKIMDLARNMIRLSGLQENVDVSIKVTGLRPGEKMYEELVAYGEEFGPTSVPKVNVLKQTQGHLDQDVLAAMVRRLEEHGLARRPDDARALLWRLIELDNERTRDGVDGFTSRCVHTLIREWSDTVSLAPPASIPERGCILAILKDAEIESVLRDVLAGAGYELQYTSSSSEALTRIAEEEYAAVLCDYVLPKGTVVELRNRIREAGLEIPVLAMSMYDSQKLAEVLEFDGLLPVLKKPFSTNDLIEALSK